jgi:lipoprotein-anchoring transpeptidase ErfK/SrfK
MLSRFKWLTLLLVVLNFFSLGTSVFAAAKNSPLTRRNLLEAERLLSKLGYWVIKTDGKVDPSTRQAILAFQKVEGRKRTGTLSNADLETLRYATRPTAKFMTGAAHIEIDISRQVLFLTDSDGVVQRILPVSTGNEKKYFDKGEWQIAHTPRGRFRIAWKYNGVRKSTLGSLYYPSYFVGGVAIHGSGSVPATPASHGCVRIPRFAEREFFKLAPVGMEVMVYD